ncbi:MAG: flap endonuclease-1 [Candidatus Diapherotrites archaeon]|nr:flap endonuclease-1 [Candidatus Diapherotrites archaeon]
MGTAIGELVVKEEIELGYLSGRIVGIDSYNIIYQFLSSIRGPDGTPLMDAEGNVTSHLTGLLYRTTNLMEKGVKPVFVFDGKPHRLKEKTLEERRKTRTDAIEKHEQALREGNLEDAKKFGSRALRLSDEMISGAKKLLGYMGLPVIEAPSDGEAQISQMCARGALFGCISQDYDSLLFGTPLLLRNIAVSGKRKAPGRNFYVDVAPEKIELSKNLEALGISREKLIWIAILIGTDFNEKFPLIGPKKALALVKKFNSFGEIVKETGFEPGFDYREIEEIFLNPPYSQDFKIEFQLPDREKILDFLVSQHGFSSIRVESALKKLEGKSSEKGGQSNLEKWF